MKKKPIFLALLAVLAVSLSSCDFIYRFFDEDEWGIPMGDNSSRAPISDVSTPPPGDTNANRASYKYSDYVKNNVYRISSTPSTGTARLLIIPIWFNDSSNFINESKKENVRSDIEKTYFGSNSDTGWRSVKSFYEEESLGALTLSGTVSEWYECNKSYTYYGEDEPNSESGVPKTSALVESATNWYFSNHTSEKRTDYDCDNDGYLDGVMLIYAAPDYDTLNRDSYDNLWAYCFWIQDEKNIVSPTVNAFFWASYDFMYGQEVASARTGKLYHAGDTSHCSLDSHTYTHEMGHMFGLEDYYDYSNNSYQPAGGFSMQDHNVGCHDPFSSFALGWGKAYVPIESTIIDLKPFATDGEMIILSPSWNTYNSPFDEYLILEYFTDSGLNEHDVNHPYMRQYGKSYPTGSKDYGIRLWHVDARLLYTTTGEFSANKVTTNPIYPAGGVNLMMSNTYYDGTDYSESYCSALGTSYANYNLLQMIRNNTSATYKPKDMLTSSALFKAGDTFSMSKYSRQFVNAGKLNSKTDLGFTFEVNACNSTYASITITKA